MFCLENPSTGCLTNRPFMRELNAHRRVVDYCRYKCAVGGKRALSWAPPQPPPRQWSKGEMIFYRGVTINETVGLTKKCLPSCG